MNRDTLYEAVWLIARVAAVVFVVPATYYFVYWLPFSLIPLEGARWIANVVSLLCAIAAGRFVWTRLATAGQGALSSAMMGAVLLGGIGFTAGFFGPLIFAPEANQGPLLGILFTGPLGLVIGAVAGLLHWMVRGRSAIRR